MIHRRSLITGLVSLVAAPAIVRASSLMPVKLWKPQRGKFYWEVMDGPPLMPEPWTEFSLINGGPGFAYAPPEGFKPFSAGDCIEFKVDLRENRGWCRRTFA